MSNIVEKSVAKESKALLNGEKDVQNKYYEV
jgi:hypothetical protein